MRQKGLAPIIILLIIALIAIVGLYVYGPKALDNLISNPLNRSESTNQSAPDDSLPTTTPSESPAKTPTTTLTPTISTPTSTPTTQPNITPTPYPTSSENWEEGPPSKKDRPYVGG